MQRSTSGQAGFSSFLHAARHSLPPFHGHPDPGHARALTPLRAPRAAQAMYRVAGPSLGLLRGCAPCMAAQPVGTLLPDRSEEAHVSALQGGQPGDMSDAMQPRPPRPGGSPLAPWDDREHSHAGGRGPVAYHQEHPDDGDALGGDAPPPPWGDSAYRDSLDDPLVSDLHAEQELDPPELRLRPPAGAVGSTAAGARGSAQHAASAAAEAAARALGRRQGGGSEGAGGGEGCSSKGEGQRGGSSNVVPAPRRAFSTARGLG